MGKTIVFAYLLCVGGLGWMASGLPFDRGAPSPSVDITYMDHRALFFSEPPCGMWVDDLFLRLIPANGECTWEHDGPITIHL